MFEVSEIMIILVESVIKAAIFFTFLLFTAAFSVWTERRVAAFMQDRIGPNRTGPAGIFQPFADVFKLFFKEDFVPKAADKFVHAIAPMISVAMAGLLYTVMPLAHYIEIGGRTIYIGIAPNINIGVLFILGMTSLAVYGFILAAWASNNKYSLLGGLRSSAQMISYELSMGMSIVGVVMVCSSLGTNDIILHQAGWKWNVLLQPLGFLVYFISALAEVNRTPFDLPEAEQELVSGYNTEYTGMRFGMFYLSEYANMATSSLLMVVLYFGGWQLPFPQEWLGLEDGTILLALVQAAIMIAKAICFVFVIIWIRWSIPRFRYDQVMKLGWKVLIPLSLINLVVTAFVVYFM